MGKKLTVEADCHTTQSCKWITEKELAEILGCSRSLLQKERHFSRGVPYYRLGGRSIRYKMDDVYAYLQERRVSHE